VSNIIIDDEFKRILPALDELTYAWLEENILEYGCREPLVLWNGILIDGHNRYEILKKHGLPIDTVDMEFGSRDEVLIWIISTQVSRRNLNPMQLSFYRGLHYNADKRVVTNAAGVNQYKEVDVHNGHQPPEGSTAARLAEVYNVSRTTIRRDARVASAISAIGEESPEMKRDILSGKLSVTRKQLQQLSSGSEEDVAEIVSQMREGSFEGRGSSASVSRQPWEVEFSKMTNDFRQIMRGFSQAEDTSSVRTALRSYINMLEDLYKNI
jgi:hypothetical protein